MTSDAGETVGKGEHLFTAGESTNWYYHWGNQWEVPQKKILKTTDSHDLVIPL